jgi:hypothetical protein
MTAPFDPAYGGQPLGDAFQARALALSGRAYFVSRRYRAAVAIAALSLAACQTDEPPAASLNWHGDEPECQTAIAYRGRVG